MMTPAIPPAPPKASPAPVPQAQNWENIFVEQFQHSSGEAHCHYGKEHTLCLSLAPRPVRLRQVREGKTYTGLYGKGDLSIIPAEVPFFARWDEDDNYLQIRLTARWIQQVASEALEINGDCLEILPEFRTRDPQIEAIGMMLLAELHQESTGNRLYIESLANILAVHLIRHYTIAKPAFPVYEGGLTQHQLLQVLDYIHEHLHEDINLATLAALLNISQFHFSHQFKQSIGITPYQYLLQQRIERAKQLLKGSDRPITDIAFSCGFSSHSHLSRQFRQLTGMTPKAYRLH
jgi:AraC family transcriptional regulator